MMRSKAFLVLLTVAASIVFSHWPTASHAGPPTSSWLNKTKTRVVLPPSSLFKSRPVPAPAVPGWSFCADAYQALADAVAGLVDPVTGVRLEPVAHFLTLAGRGSSSELLSFDCYPVTATTDLQQAAFRGNEKEIALGRRGKELRSCWNSDRGAPGWPSRCRHPQQIADDIATSEAGLDAAGQTDEGMVDEQQPINRSLERESGLGGSGFSVSGIPYFLIRDDAESLGLFEAASIRFLRDLAPFVPTRAVYDNYYKEGQTVICVNRYIALIAAACR